MTTCPRCGRENAADARFCSNCGASLVTRVSVQERRVVTAMFADLARSTGMGEALDPEIVRGIVGRFFELCSREVAARGGAIEKFSGDAVMAVFGIPSAHEDDPERAVRAALAIRDGVGDGVLVRVGVESGEVVVGDPFGGATMATGDAMNVAARLEQQAQPGEVVIGANVHEAVRDLVTAEPLGELALRGREGAVPGWRVSAVSADVGRPRGVPGLEAPLTGRDEELAALLNAAEHARGERKAVLFTIFGVPGVGKSRLTREATARLADDGWRVVRGRCLPYGDGITYWPMAEIVRALAGIEAEMTSDEAFDRLHGLAPDADSAELLAEAIGIRAPADGSPQQSGAKDIAFAFRRLLESVAAQAPLVLIFEDIHWAEPPMLDLIEYLATWMRDAPALIVCPSRPELLDTRPAWGSGRMEASRISLEPLTEEESRSLLGALLTVEDLPPELRQRVLDRAEGNPLYVEEVVRMLIEGGVVERRDGHWFATQAAADVRVPDSVEALIRARLDTLPAPERVLLQAGSVVGRVFQRSAVASIASEEQVPRPLEQHLEDAILRDLITEERAPDEPSFRFRHILIRDVAYNTLPKARRADLHVAVAGWLREWAGARMDEFIEIEAYHLEQAVLLRREVGATVDPQARDDAVQALLEGARKATARDDARALRSFAERALALEPSGESRLEAKWLQADAASRQAEFLSAARFARALEADAEAAGRRDIVGRAMSIEGSAKWLDPDAQDTEAGLALLRQSRDILTEVGDWYYLTVALEYLGFEGWWKGEFDTCITTWEEMRRVAREHGLPVREAQALVYLGMVEGMRGTPKDRKRRLLEARQLAETTSNRQILARIDRALATIVAWSESLERGEEMLRRVEALLDELGDLDEQTSALTHLGDALYRQDRFSEALAAYEKGLALAHEHIGQIPEFLSRIAQTHLALGDIATAADAGERAVDIVAKDDWATVARTSATLGAVRAAQGHDEEAEALLREGVRVIDRTEFQRWEEHQWLAEFLLSRGRFEEGQAEADKVRVELMRYGSASPVLAWANERLESAEAAAAPKDAGRSAAKGTRAG